MDRQVVILSATRRQSRTSTSKGLSAPESHRRIGSSSLMGSPLEVGHEAV